MNAVINRDYSDTCRTFMSKHYCYSDTFHRYLLSFSVNPKSHESALQLLYKLIDLKFSVSIDEFSSIINKLNLFSRPLW